MSKTDIKRYISSRFGIDVLGFSADGDVRLLNTMKHFTRFCNQNKTEEEVLFSPINTEELICTQDTIHIATKNRNRLLKPSNFLTMGNKIASVSHLKILVETVPKDVHGVVMKSCVGFDITDEWMGAILLAGLTDKFQPFIMGIEASEAKITSDTIVSKLLDAESGDKSGEAFMR